MNQVKLASVDMKRTMKKIFWVNGLWVSFLLAGCGSGGGSGGGDAVAPAATPQSPYVVETSVFSPVAGQAQMGQSVPAPLSHPRLMTFDGTYLYVATGVDNSVVRIDPNGIQTTLNGFAGSPVGVAVRSGTLYVTQTSGLYQLDNLSLVNGNSVAVTPQLVANSGNTNCRNCLGLLFNGDVAYASDGSTTLQTYDTFNKGWRSISLSSPAYGLALQSNYLSTTDYSGGLNVYAVSAITSTWSSLAQKAITGQPYGVAIASNGDVYVSSYAASTVTRIRGGVVDASPYLDSTKVCHPLGLAINEATQSLYVASERSSSGCGLPGQSTGYILRASINLGS